MNTQPYPLTVADLLDDELRRNDKLTLLYEHAAHELRRLHEVNAVLVEALNSLVNMAEHFADELHDTHPDVIAAKAALSLFAQSKQHTK